MDMIRHQMPFNNFYTFVTAQLLYYLSDILFILIINYFSSILWSEDDMIFAHPFCMCECMFFLRHKLPFLSAI